MNQKAIFFAATLVAAALAGCANEPAGDTTTTPTGSTTPATGTPVTTPTTTPAVTPTPGGDEEGPGGPPEMMECEGDYELDNTSTRLGMPELRYVAKDPDANDPCFAFVGPRNATAGWNVFTLTYPAGGRTFHIMPMYFHGERSSEEFIGAMMSSNESRPDWIKPVGAVGGVTPGQTGSVAIELEAGNYTFFCPIEGHMFQGMHGSLRVAEAEEGANATAPPAADATITLVDYNFTLPELREGMTVIRVTNNGTEPHEAPLVKLNAGANMSAFLAAIESETPTGPPPGALIGGVNAIAPGQTVYLLVDIEADTTYGFVCFVESEAHGGMPHIALGMIGETEAHHAEGEEH
ncbi:MAG TPA: hypothetical protein VFH78_05070 [Candidatus Thermoplasmatota archaeon]|nr:hypothetical protein [Candidatus Thermoplasmatota archaeon]